MIHSPFPVPRLSLPSGDPSLSQLPAVRGRAVLELGFPAPIQFREPSLQAGGRVHLRSSPGSSDHSGNAGLVGADSNLEQNERAVVVGGSTAGEGGDVGEHGFKNVARRTSSKIHDVTQDALLAKTLAARPACVRQTVRKETQNGLAALE